MPKGDRLKLKADPEDGTVMFRIVDQKLNKGTLWYYINLPPPYMPTEDARK
jgi:hypothetical protein